MRTLEINVECSKMGRTMKYEYEEMPELSDQVEDESDDSDDEDDGDEDDQEDDSTGEENFEMLNSDEIKVDLENLDDDVWLNMILKAWDCENCKNEIQLVCMPDCTECGRGIGEEELNIALEGYDVVGLFPALESVNTGKIIREEIKRSNMKVNGFNWRQAARYIVMNRKYTSDLESIEEILPKSRSGKEKSMKNKNVNHKKENIDKDWEFREGVLPTKEQERELLARVGEIGTRMIFENSCYQFGGEKVQTGIRGTHRK